MIVFLNNIEPLQYRGFELRVSLFLGFMLYVKHWWQITVFKPYLTHEMLSLALGRRMDTVEVVGTARKTVLSRLMEVLTEVLVGLGTSLRGLDHHEADGASVDRTLVLQLIPVNMTLMVRYIDAVNLVTLRVADIAIEGTPAKTKRSYEEIVEEPDVGCNNG